MILDFCGFCLRFGFMWYNEVVYTMCCVKAGSFLLVSGFCNFSIFRSMNGAARHGARWRSARKLELA